MKHRRGRSLAPAIAALIGALLSISHPAAGQGGSKGVLYGFTGFPYEFTAESLERVNALIRPNATLYAIHKDQCVPWAEALARAPYPPWLEEGLRGDRAYIAPGQAVYVAVTPTRNDRRTLASPCGASEDAEGRLPRELRNAKLNDPAVKRAYVNYVERIIEVFNPRFLNIGIEISELALRHPEDWPAFQDLYLHTYREIKRAHPEIRIGIEMVLQSLLAPKVAALVKPAVEASDYLCISFYPYTSSFGVFWGAPPLPPPPEEWLAPLEWLRTYTTKPLAVCETGYSTEKLTISVAGGLPITGDTALQKSFLEDLIRIAVRDEYLFVVWFILVDYTKLLVQMAGAPELEAMRIWVHTGLFTSALEPKPAWAAWELWKQSEAPAAGAGRAGAASAPAPSATPAPSPPSAPTPPSAASAPPAVGRAAAAADSAAAPAPISPPTLECSPDSTVETGAPGPRAGIRAALWTIRYAGEWALCRTDATPPPDARGVRLWLRSDRDDVVMIRLEGKAGEVFFALAPAGPEWRESAIPFDRFAAESQGGGGRLRADGVAALTLAEGGGPGGAGGSRRIWIAGLEFYR